MKPMTVSSNWKSLAPLIKKGSGKVDKDKEKEEVWFEVNTNDLERSKQEVERMNDVRTVASLFPPVSTNASEGVGRYVALDCEMVGVGAEGQLHALARVSIVNYHGHVILDSYVKPLEQVVDYRTAVSGIKPHHLRDARSLKEVREEVCKLLEGKIVIGHALHNDFACLMLSHPRSQLRDTTKFRPFRAMAKGKNPSLRRLAQEVLGVKIQDGEHDSVEDARVAMLLYRKHKDEWENYLFRGEGRTFKAQKRSKK